MYSFQRDTLRDVWCHKNKYSSDVCKVMTFLQSQRYIFSLTLRCGHVRTNSRGQYLDLKRMMMEKIVIHNEFIVLPLRPKLR
jgi:hypothetical protein